MSRRDAIAPVAALAAAPGPVVEEAPDGDEIAITSLPFVRDTTPAERCAGMLPRIFWDVQPCGDYDKDFRTGESYACQALEYTVSQNFAPLLGWVIFDMMRNGPDCGGIEAGFLSVFGHAAALGALLEPQVGCAGPLGPKNRLCRPAAAQARAEARAALSERVSPCQD